MASYYLVLLKIEKIIESRVEQYDVASIESWYYSNYIPTHAKELLKKTVDAL